MLVYSVMSRNPSPRTTTSTTGLRSPRPPRSRRSAIPSVLPILSLLHERAATVSELAVALERPKSTVAHHVRTLTEAGLLQVVRTRRVRAIEERFYGRTARLFYVAVERSPDGDELPRDFNDFEVAARESAAAYGKGKLWGFIRHARISEAQASRLGAVASWWRSSTASELGRDRVRIRGRRLSHRPADASEQRQLSTALRFPTSEEDVRVLSRAQAPRRALPVATAAALGETSTRVVMALAERGPDSRRSGGGGNRTRARFQSTCGSSPSVCTGTRRGASVRYGPRLRRPAVERAAGEARTRVLGRTRVGLDRDVDCDVVCLRSS